MARVSRLRNVRLRRVSLVDRPAEPGAVVELYKRDDVAKSDPSSSDTHVDRPLGSEKKPKAKKKGKDEPRDRLRAQLLVDGILPEPEPDKKITKGEAAGHAFRGNQHTGGIPGNLGPAEWRAAANHLGLTAQEWMSVRATDDGQDPLNKCGFGERSWRELLALSRTRLAIREDARATSRNMREKGYSGFDDEEAVYQEMLEDHLAATPKELLLRVPRSLDRPRMSKEQRANVKAIRRQQKAAKREALRAKLLDERKAFEEVFGNPAWGTLGVQTKPLSAEDQLRQQFKSWRSDIGSDIDQARARKARRDAIRAK